MVDVKIDTRLMHGALQGIHESTGNVDSRFVEQLRFHRISGRVLELADELADVLTEEQMRLVQMVREEELSRIDRMFETIQTIVPKIDTNQALIQVKGTSVGEHLGTKVSRLRPSRDIDLIGSDLGCLSRAGYRLVQPGICHELGTYSKTDLLDVDLHQYLPSWSTGGDRIHSTPIDLDTIRQHSVPSALWAGKVGIPGVTLAALIICSHLYIDHVEHPVFREAPVRLAEIFEFDELRRHAQFDPTQFDLMTRQFGVAEARRFVESVIALTKGELERLTTRVEIARGVLREATLDRQSAFDSARVVDQVTAPGCVELTAPENCSVYAISDAPLEGMAWGGADEAGQLPTLVANLARTTDNMVRLGLTATLVSGYYKDELRLTTGTGSVAIQRNPVDGATGLREAGPTQWEFISHAEPGRLVLEVDLELPPGDTLRAIVSCHSFPAPITDDWNDFYRTALASGCMILELRG